MSIQNPDAAVEFWPGREFGILFAPITDDTVPADAPGHQHVRRTTLADCVEYVPTAYERDNPDRGSHRCAQCGCRAQSHAEPLRSRVIRVLGLAPGLGPDAAAEARPTGTDA